MNQTILKELLLERFGEVIEIISFDKKTDRLPLLNNEDYSWRDYLLQIFELRMKHADKRNVDPDVLEETKNFIEHLKKLPEDAILYIWQAKSVSNSYGGWASEESLIYALKI